MRPAGLCPPSRLSVLDERALFIRETLATAAAVGLAGAVLLLCLGSGVGALAYGAGAAVSLGNFLLIARAVKALGAAEAVSLRGLFWKGSLFRFSVMAAAVGGALALFRGALVALLAGLLITQVAMVAVWLVRAVRAAR
jgi:hypothetical protein